MKLWKKILLLLLAILFVIATVLGIQGYKMYASVKDSIDDKISEIRKDANYTKSDDLPEKYKEAVVSVEDRRFYEHGAIDIISIGRAIFTNIKEFDLVEGGSTITQQVAKNVFFTQEQEATRKIAEIFMAFDLEKKYSKDEILELYVNTSYFGSGHYGIREASLGYFEKEPKEMDLNESTLLAGVPNAPSAYAPDKHPDLAKKRQKHVIKSMVKNGKLTQDEADAIP